MKWLPSDKGPAHLGSQLTKKKVLMVCGTQFSLAVLHAAAIPIVHYCCYWWNVWKGLSAIMSLGVSVSHTSIGC